jgi:hypothetical protein
MTNLFIPKYYPNILNEVNLIYSVDYDNLVLKYVILFILKLFHLSSHDFIFRYFNSNKILFTDSNIIVEDTIAMPTFS